MKNLTDTGKQIDQDMRERYGRAESEADVARRQQAEEDRQELHQRPQHAIAAMGVTVLVVGTLLVALTVTALFAVSAFIAVPVLIVFILVGGIWAFSSLGRRKRSRHESSTIPGDAVPGE